MTVIRTKDELKNFVSKALENRNIGQCSHILRKSTKIEVSET